MSDTAETRKKRQHLDMSCDTLVVGGGMVGLLTAFALAEANRDVVLCAPKISAEDPRTTAILDEQLRYLDKLGLWESLVEHAHPLRIMRLVDATNRLLRFQQTDFDAAETGLEAFGYTVRNQALMDELFSRLGDMNNVTLLEGTVMNIETDGQKPVASLRCGEGDTLVETGLVVGADGRNSFVRARFGYGEREWRYPQSAIVLDFHHDIPSMYTSTEFHTETGPFTIVPQSEHRAGLVWLETPQRADEIVTMQKHALENLIEEKMHSFLGKIQIESQPRSFPMTGMVAKCFGDRYHALVGEAAHVFPPIGAQGFNLGIRDVSALVDATVRFTGSESPGVQYNRARNVDINSRTYGVDILNRTLLSDLLPAQLAKTLGMFALRNIRPLRQRVMASGMGSSLLQ